MLACSGTITLTTLNKPPLFAVVFLFICYPYFLFHIKNNNISFLPIINIFNQPI